MKDRTRRINAAIRQAKIRDHHRCRVCGSTPVDGAHLNCRNNPNPRFEADNPDHIISLCRKHHIEFDEYKTDDLRARWLWAQGMDSLSELFLEDVKQRR